MTIDAFARTALGFEVDAGETMSWEGVALLAEGMVCEARNRAAEEGRAWLVAGIRFAREAVAMIDSEAKAPAAPGKVTCATTIGELAVGFLGEDYAPAEDSYLDQPHVLMGIAAKLAEASSMSDMGMGLEPDEKRVLARVAAMLAGRAARLNEKEGA